MNSTSPRFSIDGVDLKKVLTGLWVSLAGVGVTLLTMLGGANYHLVIGKIDLSAVLTLLVSSLNSLAVNVLRKYVADHTDQ